MKQSVIITSLVVFVSSFHRVDQNASEVCIYTGRQEQLYAELNSCLTQMGVKVRLVDKLDKHNPNLHIICDASLVPFQYFPAHYIVYQTLNLDETPLTQGYLDKLNGAVAVWDPSWRNIGKYSLLCEHYYHCDLAQMAPLLLPTLLPTITLAAYKQLLSYANHKDTDISSHLPVIFAHSILQKPEIVIESGVRSGESSLAFKAALAPARAKLIGIDIDSQSAAVYQRLELASAEFKVMDDLNFPAWWRASSFAQQQADIIFIDTSHYYDHTLKELDIFVPLLRAHGFLMFHDTNMCPGSKNVYQRLNNTAGIGWNNAKGVVRAVKEYFTIEFDESRYTQLEFNAREARWSLLHYPYCNGLTLVKK